VTSFSALIGQLELPRRKRVPHVNLECAAFLHLRDHIGLEAPESVASVRLGSVQRQIRALHQMVAVGPIIRRNRNSYAAGRIDLLAVNDDWFPHPAEEPVRQRLCG
jgi:hypothetical protein